MLSIVGKTVAAWRGIPEKSLYQPNKMVTELRFIIFDDKETIMELKEQNSYDYHDCNNYARTIHVYTDKILWQRLMDKEGFKEPTEFPFI